MTEEKQRPRRVSGEGGLFERGDGKWVAQLSIGPRNNRKRIQRVRLTRAAAKDALDDLKDDLKAGVSPSKLSLGNYLRSWLDNSAKPTISANTYRGYDDAIALWAPIHHVALSKLTAEDIEAASNAMLSTKGPPKARRHEPASPKTIRNAQIMLRRALGQAEARGHVRRNVARLVPLRRVPKRRPDALTPERARAILAAVKDDRYEAAYALAFIGLRESEILGLARTDVDLVKGTALVRYQIVGSGENAARAELKSAASEAPVPLPRFVVERLQAHVDRDQRPVAALDRGLVFVTPAGYAVNGSWLLAHFKVLLANAGLETMTIHQLRHGAATLLMGAGAHPRVAQELLRHASSRTTMDIYSHVTGSQQREAADLLQQAIDPPSHAASHTARKARKPRGSAG